MSLQLHILVKYHLRQRKLITEQKCVSRILHAVFNVNAGAHLIFFFKIGLIALVASFLFDI